MENIQINSNKLGKYFIDKMLDNTENVFEQSSITKKDIDVAFEKNNQLAGIMTFANLNALIIFQQYSEQLNKFANEYFDNTITSQEDFIYKCHKLRDEINDNISTN